MPPREVHKTKVIGESAYEAVLDRLLTEMVVTDGLSATRDMSEDLARVRAAAEGADYLGAIRLLGAVEVTLSPTRPKPGADSVQPGDVEQALGDLRRAIPRWGSGKKREDAEALCREARGAAGEGRWHAAWALIEEADARLGEGHE